MSDPQLVRYPLDALVSFHYYRREEQMENVLGTKRLCLIGDSGAFSAFTQGQPIVFTEYLAWVRRWLPYLAWAAALDVIGDPAATLRNWRAMRDEHALATVPTLHVGTDPAWLGNYAREGCDFIALGGMVGRALQALPWVVNVFRYARDHHPELRFHIWGVTSRRVLDNVPAYSADSSGILGAAYRFGTLRLFDPRTARHTTVPLRRHDVFKVGRLLRDQYNVDPETIIRSTPENRHVLIQIAARATQLYADWLARRHNVSPPTWAVKTPPHLDPQPGATTPGGPRVHLVGNSGVVSPDARGNSLMELTGRPAGTRLHLAGGGGTTGGQDNLCSGVGALDDTRPGPNTGPRLHIVDTLADTLASAATGNKPAGWGTRVHLVDGATQNLVSAGTPAEQEQP